MGDTCPAVQKSLLQAFLQTVCDITTFSHVKMVFKLLKGVFMFELVKIISVPKNHMFQCLSCFIYFNFIFHSLSLQLVLLCHHLSFGFEINFEQRSIDLKCSGMNFCGLQLSVFLFSCTLLTGGIVGP